jgi:hypothetical protein
VPGRAPSGWGGGVRSQPSFGVRRRRTADSTHHDDQTVGPEGLHHGPRPTRPVVLSLVELGRQLKMEAPAPQGCLRLARQLDLSVAG